jgi:hypothetical protein
VRAVPGFSEYDVPVGMDIWRNSPQSPNCVQAWRGTRTVVNGALVGTGVVLVAAPVAAEVAVSAPGLGVNLSGSLNTFRQFTIYNRYGNLLSVGRDIIRGWHIGLGASATGRSLWHLPLNPLKWFGW